MAILSAFSPTTAPQVSHDESGAVWGWGSPTDGDSLKSINLGSCLPSGRVYATFYNVNDSSIARIGYVDANSVALEASSDAAGAGGVSADASADGENVFYEVRLIAKDVADDGTLNTPKILLTVNGTASDSITMPTGFAYRSRVLWGCSATADMMGSGTSADLQLFVQRGRTCQYLPGGGYHSGYDFDGIEVVAAATQADSLASVALGKYAPNVSLSAANMAYGNTRGSALLWLNFTSTNATDSDFQVYYAPSGTIAGTAIEAGGLEPPTRLYNFGNCGTGTNMTKQHSTTLEVPLTSFQVGSNTGSLDTVIAYSWSTARAGQTGQILIKSWALPG